MKIEVVPGYAVLLDGEPRVKVWTWGFRRYGEWTADARKWGHHGITIRLGRTRVAITLPGRGYL